jgi:hypothetical protein
MLSWILDFFTSMSNCMHFMGKEKSVEYQLVHMTSMMLFQALEMVIFLLGLPLCWPMQRTIELTTTFTRH